MYCSLITSLVFERVVYPRLRDPADCYNLLLHEYNHDLDSRRAQDFEEHKRQSPSTLEESIGAGSESYENCAYFRNGLKGLFPLFAFEKDDCKDGTSKVITFIFCWTPFHIRNIFQVWNIIPGAHTWKVHFCQIFFNDEIILKFILDFANLGCAANSVLNPFIYSFLSTQFRQKLCMVINQRIRRPAGATRTATRRL